MVELDPQSQETLSDYRSDAMAIASAFQAASDDDTRNVMNAMANKTQKSLESLKFYVVPSSWFLKAWPLLTSRSAAGVHEEWRDQIGRIQNSELLSVERAISSSDDEDDSNISEHERQRKRFERLHRKMARNRQESTMRKGLVHKQHYFFLGPSAWILVKEKFGFDGHELGRNCVFTGTSQNVVAIQLHADEAEHNDVLIPIPPSGRFAYEKVVSKESQLGCNATTSDVVSEDDGEANDELPWAGAGSETNNTSANPQTEEAPVLLLPASTTNTADQSDNSKSKNIYPSVDEMEVDTSTADEKATSSTSASAVVNSMAGRKRFASGLGNLGNTCFMNSTVQCLAHTEPLRRYFLSGDYEPDLNRENPLGTGGELATQFAYLLSEMWGVPSKRRNVLGSNDYNYANTSTSAVYPRSFKYTLGKHAEQFMGYDQHDSQELATYLLDALHEDTNRVTKKPYIEKPEQGEDESDDVAAMKAWRLHLQRENSKVLENFMGQVKSRVQCCEEGCNRVSTTFDPFMYLSVPIPGATDRSLKVTFIPLDPEQKMRNLVITLSKTASMNSLLSKVNEQLVKLGVRDEPIPLHDLCPVDVWSHEVYSWYSSDSEIDRIRDTDNTFVYELRSLSEVREASQKDAVDESVSNWDNRTKYRSHRFKLDLETMTRLNNQDEWTSVLENYVHQPTLLYSMFNPNRGTIDERMKFHQRLENFIDVCHKETAEEESTGLKRSREESDSSGKSEVTVSPSDETIQSLSEWAESSTIFRNVKNRHDVAVLEFCANKVRQFIMRLIREKKNKYKDGIMIQVVMRRPPGTTGAHFPARDHTFASPLVIRIPSNMTVYGLREELANRLSRSLHSGYPSANSTQAENSGESSAETTGKSPSTPSTEEQPFGSPSLLVLRQIPLTYDKKGSYACKSNLAGHKALGMLERPNGQTKEETRPASMATPSDEAELELVSEVVGPNGTVNMDWSVELSDRCFDLTEYEHTEGAATVEDGLSSRTRTGSKVTSVSDCIDKYCQMEQLEETEMWYCNRCKKHVRAWKQFHLYSAPPILIVHLKRFHYSATTHRRDKIGALIDFPLEGLDLTEKVSHWTDEEKPIYDCYAVSNHFGGLGGGHYTAYTLSDDGTWCHYDDSRISNSVDPREVVSEAAYVLYYRRRDVPIGQDRIDDEPAPAIVVEQAEATRESSEISSNNTAQAGDDDMVVEGADAGSAASSRTCSSHMGSMEVGDDPNGYENDEYSGNGGKVSSTQEDYPLQ